MYSGLHKITDTPLDRNIYNKLSIRYLFALTSIALAIITSQALIQNFLKKQLGDSRVVNVAGRQRMLSQKITKEALLIFHSENTIKRQAFAEKLEKSLDLWYKSHHALVSRDSAMLLYGTNSDTINIMFQEMAVYFNGVYESAIKMIEMVKQNSEVQNSELKNVLDIILENENHFLPRMDKIVNQYDSEALQKVKDVIQVETILLIIALCILVFEFFFIFQPTASFIKKVIQRLLQTEAREKQSYKNILKIKTEEQNLRASLIFEGQERERRRLSRDLHDGIGQMLTGLKFQVEAMAVKSENGESGKFENLKELTADVIKEVRRVSFNLRPTVLSDYGLSSGIKNIVRELGMYTETDLEFINETGFDQRLDKKIETHLYRITQEAINNALKYSKSEKVTIRLWHRGELVGISVKDNGIGFNLPEMEEKDIRSGSGHGIFNMKERATYINADLRIKTAKGKGTEITVYLPLN